MLSRTAHIAIEVLGALALAIVLAVAVLGWRLSQGPLPLGVLKPYVEQALHDEKSPFRISVGEVELIWSRWNRPIDLRATDVRLADAEDRPLASAPQMSLGLSVRALARGLVAPTSLELLGPRAAMIRTADGRFELALGETGATGGPGGADMLSRIAAALLAPPDRTQALGYLRRISILGARLDIEDRQLGLSWTAPRADLVFARNRSGIRADGRLAVDLGTGEATLSGSATYRPADGTTEAALHFDGVRPASVAARFPALAALAPVELPLSGTVTATFGPDAGLRGGGFDLTASAGEVIVPRLWPAPLDVTGAHAKGTFARAPDRVTLEAASVTLAGGPRLTLSGRASREAGATALGFALDAADVPIDSFRRYWPLDVAAGAREWITANLEHGTLTQGHTDMALRWPGPGAEATVESLTGTFRMAGTTVHYLRPLPPVTDISAHGTFDEDNVTITGEGARLDGLSIDEGTVAFHHTRRRIADTDVELVVRGPLRAAMRVLDHPKLRFMQKLGIDPAKVEGQSATRLMVKFPTAKDLEFDEVDIKAAANLRGVVIPGIVLGRDLTDGNLVLRLDRKGMDVSGKARVDGLASDIVWVESFDPKARIARRYRLSTRLDAADRDRLGIATAPFLDGPVGVDLSLAQPADGPGELQVRLGLDAASLALPALEWSKPAGVPGTASAVATLADGRLRALTSVAIDAAGLDAAGRVTLGADGRSIARADVARFRVGGIDVRGTVIRGAGGRYDADIAGGTLDARPLIRRAREAGGPDLPPVTLSVRLDRLRLGTDASLSAVTGALRYDGRRLAAAALDATMPGGRRIALRLGKAGGGRRVTLDSDDGGEALRALGVYDNIRGGRLHLAATQGGDPDGPWKGMLGMANFRIVKAPALARVLSLASFGGIGNLAKDKGINFARLAMPFTYTGDRLAIDKARAAGSEIGVTAEGALDLAADTVKVNGTLVPAYTINSVLGNIPLLGKLFTGEEGSGVFAATYRLEGKLDDPDVKVNPLAALAPGFLRDLVDGLTAGGTNEPMPMPENMP